MIELALRIVFYGLVAATSPLALGATIVVLTSGRGRLNGVAFAIGVVAGQALVVVILLAVGTAWTPRSSDGTTNLHIVLDLLLGAALLVAAWRVRAPDALPARPRRPPGARTQEIRARLARLSPVTAVGSGALLGIGGPKRLGIAFIAASTLAAADVSSALTSTLAVVYIAVATVLVWGPATLYLLLGNRTTDWLERREDWIRDHQQPLVYYPSLVLGLMLVAAGIAEVVTSS